MVDAPGWYAAFGVTDDDAALLEAWHDGDRVAGDTLFRRHFDSVFRFFRHKTDDRIAEELTQTTFLALASASRRFEGRSTFKTYVFAVARRQLLMHFRRRYAGPREVDFDDMSVEDLGGTPSALVAAHQEQTLLLLALRRIPLDYQIAIELYYWEQMSTVQIALVLELPEGTVRSRLTRARGLIAEEVRALSKDPLVARRTVEGFETWARGLRDLGSVRG